MSVGVAPPYFYYYKDYIMNKTEVSALIPALQNGIVNITFKKIITNEIRIMESSLNPEILRKNGVGTILESVSPDSDHIAVWCIDKGAWRSFRVNTVTGWEIMQ